MTSASNNLHFPNAKAMTEFLSNHPSLASDYYKEKGITDTVAKLAADRFSDSDKVEFGVKIGAQLIAYDLQSGEDEITGEKIKKIEGMPTTFWITFSLGLEKALIDCAKSAIVDAEEAPSSAVSPSNKISPERELALPQQVTSAPVEGRKGTKGGCFIQ
ncbi:MAG: hypothetical protein PVI40_02615 [Chlamydiota bacterium]|jgi:hypothetical protein